MRHLLLAVVVPAIVLGTGAAAQQPGAAAQQRAEKSNMELLGSTTAAWRSTR